MGNQGATTTFLGDGPKMSTRTFVLPGQGAPGQRAPRQRAPGQGAPGKMAPGHASVQLL